MHDQQISRYALASLSSQTTTRYGRGKLWLIGMGSKTPTMDGSHFPTCAPCHFDGRLSCLSPTPLPKGMRDLCPRSFKKLNRWSTDVAKLNFLSKAIYVSEQVCIGWRRTGAYRTAKLTFSHDFSVKVWGVYCTSVHIIFEFLRWGGMEQVQKRQTRCFHRNQIIGINFQHNCDK